jgi:hypothetical protein
MSDMHGNAARVAESEAGAERYECDELIAIFVTILKRSKEAP